MSPEQITTINAIASILDKLGSLPVGTLLFVMVVGPWFAMFALSAGYQKRFDSVVRMYEANAELVKAFKSLAEDQRDLTILSTQTMQDVKNMAANNLFCPMVRKGTSQQEASK